MHKPTKNEVVLANILDEIEVILEDTSAAPQATVDKIWKLFDRRDVVHAMVLALNAYPIKD